MKALIVERDASLLETMRDICLEEGYEVVLCTSIDQAKLILKTEPSPTIVFCDQFLPLNSGLEFRRDLLSREDIRFILMRSVKSSAEVTPSSELIKPFSIDELLDLLRKR